MVQETIKFGAVQVKANYHNLLEAGLLLPITSIIMVSIMYCSDNVSFKNVLV